MTKYENHICNDRSVTYSFIVKVSSSYPTNLAFKQNLKNLNKGHFATNSGKYVICVLLGGKSAQLT